MKSRRKIDSVLVGETLGRVSASREKKIFGDFYYRNIAEGTIICRFCETPIVADGKVLSNYRMVEIPFTAGGKYRTNCCQECVRKIKAEDIEALFCSDIESWARGAEREGKTAEVHEESMKEIHAKELGTEIQEVKIEIKKAGG